MRKNLLAGTVLGAFALAGAEANAQAMGEIEWARGYEADKQSFNALLAERYAALSVFEADEMNDDEDARLFASKGFNAMEGEKVMPVKVGEYDIEDRSVRNTLMDARAALIDLKGMEGMERAARPLAIAQTAFDCWVEQEEEGYQEDDIRACRGVFYDYMDLAMDAFPQADAVTMAETRPETARGVGYTTVYFEFDSAKLTDQARNVLEDVAESAELFDISELRVFGHTDRVGSMNYNKELSQERAQTVRQALMEEGLARVDIGEVIVAGRGETQPAVATGDGVREPLNRRVNVSFVGTTDIANIEQARMENVSTERQQKPMQ